MKKCSKCGQVKPLDMFYRMQGMKDGYRNDCKACNLAAKHERYRRNPEATKQRVKQWQRDNAERFVEYQREYRSRPERKLAERAGHLKRKFGISLEDYDRLLVEQGDGCAICGDPPEAGGHLHVDHDHADGRVRGLLCVRCNNGLGQFKEEPDLIRVAAVYAGRQADDAEITALIKQRVRELAGAAR